jgi:anthranilate phosphoribosyltransferase
MLDGQATPSAVASFLTAMRLRGVTAGELEGTVAAIRTRMARWDCGDLDAGSIDTCGTGGDGACTLNISTAAAIVVAASGIPVVKHGNRAASGTSGSSDVLSHLGVAIDPDSAALARCFHELKIVFLFAPRFHPGFRHLAPIRGELPFGTLLNLAGPLCNPASPSYQLVGTTNPSQAELLAEVLARLNHVERAAVVAAEDGLDEVSLNGATHVCVIEGRRVRKTTWQPEDFDLRRQSPAELRVRDAAESARRLRRVVQGEPGAARDYVVANSAAALWVARQIPLADAVEQVQATIDTGAAASLLENWATLCPAGH